MASPRDIRLDQLLEVVGRLSALEIADALWLARMGAPFISADEEADGSRPLSMLPSPPASVGYKGAPATESPDPSGSREEPGLAAGQASGSQPEASLYTGRPDTAGSGSVPARPVRVPREAVLPDRLGIARSLRPLKQRIPVPSRELLDEQRTAEISAETRGWGLALRPQTERRFDIALVIDDSQSMGVWRETVSEFQNLLERHGAFRDVRAWRFDSDQWRRALTRYGGRARGPDDPAGTARGPRELVDPAGRRIILVVTDGVGEAWRDETMTSLLRSWSKTGPLAIVDMLPRRLWRGTSLNPWPSRLASTPRGGTQPRVFPEQPDLGLLSATRTERIDWVPVLELRRSSLAPWAAAVAGSLPGTFPVAALPLTAPARADKGQVADLPDRWLLQQPESSREIVRRFRILASPLAFDLAGYLAAAPLTLPVMRVIQRALLPVTEPAHLAELFLFGLLARVSPPARGEDPDNVLYDFPPGVREDLLSTRTRRDAFSVLDALSKVSGRIAAQFGGTLDFRALVPATGATATTTIPVGSRPFAQVAVTILEGLGGSYYGDMAREIRPRLEPSADADERPFALLNAEALSMYPHAASPAPILDDTPEIADAPIRPKSRPGRKPTGNVPVVPGAPDKPDPDHVLTWRQRKVLQVIRDSVQTRGYPPSMREIGEAVGLTSMSSVSYQLSTLQRKGYLHRDVGRPRTVEVRLPGHLAVRPEQGAASTSNAEVPADGMDVASQEATYVPLVGRIGAGVPITAHQQVEDIFPLPRQLVGEGSLFILEVFGDGMINAAIADGDWVVIRQQEDAENGEIVAAMIDGEATLNTLKQSDGHMWLIPHNPAFTPILGDDASILGKVVAVIRRISTEGQSN
jgi:SOS regulatory protein LexA